LGNGSSLGLELAVPLEVTQSPKVAVVGDTVTERTTGGTTFTVAEFDPLVAAEAGTAIKVATIPNAPAAMLTLDGRRRACSFWDS
jgi:hypothetical protein